MKAPEMRQKRPEDLQHLLAELLKEQFNLRMQRGSGQLGRPSRVREVRREIARLKTMLKERTSANK